MASNDQAEPNGGGPTEEELLSGPVDLDGTFDPRLLDETRLDTTSVNLLGEARSRQIPAFQTEGPSAPQKVSTLRSALDLIYPLRGVQTRSKTSGTQATSGTGDQQGTREAQREASSHVQQSQLTRSVSQHPQVDLSLWRGKGSEEGSDSSDSEYHMGDGDEDVDMPDEQQAKFDELKRKLGGRKGALTRATKKFEQTYEDKSISDLERLGKCRAHLTEIKSQWEKVDEVWVPLSELVSDEGYLAALQAEIDPYYDKVTNCTYLVEVLENSKKESEKPIEDKTVFSFGTRKLRKFNGEKPEDWHAWIAEFDALIKPYGASKYVSDVERLALLKEHVTGRAGDRIKDLQMSSSGYASARRILEGSYGSFTLQFQRIHARILHCKPAKEYTFEEIDRIRNVHLTNMMLMENLGFEVEKTIGYFMTIARETYPKELIQLWDVEHPDSVKRIDYTISEFMNFVEQRMNSIYDPRSEAKKSGDNKQPQEKKKESGHCLRASGAPQKSSKEKKIDSPQCNLCQKGHPTWKCKEWQDAAAVHKKLRRKKLCFVCGEKFHEGHMKACKGHACKESCGRILPHRKGHCHIGLPATSQSSNSGSQNRALLTKGKIEFIGEVPEVSAQIPWIHTTPKLCRSKAALEKTMIMEAITCTAIFYSKKRTIERKVRLFLDSGASVNLVRRDLVKDLQLEEAMFGLTVAGDKELPPTSEKKVEFRLKALNGGYVSPRYEAYSQRSVTSIEGVKMNYERFEHLKGLDLSKVPREGVHEIDVLVGIEVYNELELAERRHGSNRGEPVAKLTKLGWILSGLVSVERCLMTKKTDSTTAALKTALNRLWALDSIGITDPTSSDLTMDQERALKMFREKIVLRDGKYYVPMLWKDENPELMDNLHRAKQREKSLCEKYNKPGMEEKKKKIIEAVNEFIKNEYAKKIQAEELETRESDGPIRYLSMQIVFRDNKPLPRPVFDASECTADGKSLNSQLLPGPPNINDLVEVMIRFRSRPVALVGDIKGMFLAIGLADGKDSHRFVWRELDPSRDVEHYKLQVVTFGVTDSPFKSVETTKHHADENKSEYPLGHDLLKNDCYVDDLLGGKETEEEAIELFKEIDELLAKGGFKLMKVLSNSDLVMNSVPEEKRAPMTARVLDEQGESREVDKSHSALGTTWDPRQDTLLFRFSEKLEKVTKHTKRIIVSNGSKLYDPTGLVSPVTLNARRLMRECSDMELDWDDKVPKETIDKFEKWREDIVHLNEVSIPRCLIPKNAKERELHIFTDASAYAYGACIYVRTVDEKGQISARLVISKNRLSPKDQLDKKIPRLELLGCLLGVRLYKYVKKALSHVQWDNVQFWSDSEIALYWIRKDPGKLKQFVANRVKEIQEHTSQEQWRHLPGELNVAADTCSRGCEAATLATMTEWWEGPDILRMDKAKWEDIKKLPLTQEQLEQIKSEEKINLVLRAAKIPNWEHHPCKTILERYEDFDKCVWVMARLLACVRKWRKQEPVTDLGQQVHFALCHLIRWTQVEHYPTETCALDNKLPLPKDSKLAALKPVLDEYGNMCMNGRIQDKVNRDLDFSSCPTLLPPKALFTKKFIMKAHRRVKHAMVEQTLYSIRKTVWIVDGKQAVKDVLKNCQFCKIRKAKLMEQQMADLPEERLRCEPPFTYTAVDFAGPLYYKTEDKDEKSYFLLFNCLGTRAIHLELVNGLSTKDFLEALRRMTARRGWPVRFYSDNARTFKRAEKDLCMRISRLNFEEIYKILPNTDVVKTDNTISWAFTAPKASWWGGVYERMIGTVKSRLRASLGRARLTFRELETTLIEVEAIVNSRPLAAIKASPEEPIPISPGHFLIGRTPVIVPEGNQSEDPTDDVGKRLRASRYMTRVLWKCFQRDYLAELQIRKKWKDEHDLEDLVGRIVIVQDESSPKARWQRGIIVSATRGRDGLIRSCEVRLHNRKIIVRAVQQLALIPDVTGEGNYSIVRERPNAVGTREEGSRFGVIKEEKKLEVKPVSHRSLRRSQLRNHRQQLKKI